MSRHSISAVVLLVLVLALAVSASPARADRKAEAKAHITRATALHGAARFAEALDELTAAYALDPKPTLLYAIGQVHVKLGNCAEAIGYYEKFLATKPARGPAGAARQAIKVCKKRPPEPAVAVEPTPAPVAEPAPEPVPEPAPVEPIPDPAPAPEPDPAPAPATVEVEPLPEPSPPREPELTTRTRPFYTDVLGDVLVGAGVASGVASVLFYRAAQSDLDAAEDAATYERSVELRDDAKGKRVFAIGFAAGAAILTGAGIVRFLTHDRTERRLAIVPARGGGFVTWNGRF